MSTNSQDQEIDLGQVFSKIGDFFQRIIDKLFDVILFVKKNIIVLIALLVIGAVLGYYLDKTSKTYDNEIIVTPNFGSVDYLYSKIALLEAKKKENDTLFFTDLGFKNVGQLGSIEVDPVIDIFKFVEGNGSGFELIKLMAEDGDINEIIEKGVTSKNYPIHRIKLSTSNKTSEETTINPLINYLNSSEYFSKIQKQTIENKQEKLKQNDSLIEQIDVFLEGFSDNISSNNKSDKLIYYNDNNNLNGIINSKENLITEKGNIKMKLINNDKIIKPISIIVNKLNTEGLNGKRKFVLPILFILIFIAFKVFISFYKNQLTKRNLA